MSTTTRSCATSMCCSVSAGPRPATRPTCSSGPSLSSCRSPAAGRSLIALEDLHWADPGTLDLISFLLRNLDGDELLLLTYRNEDWHRSPALRRLNETFARSRQVTRVELAPSVPRRGRRSWPAVDHRRDRGRTPTSTGCTNARRATRSSPRNCSSPAGRGRVRRRCTTSCSRVRRRSRPTPSIWCGWRPLIGRPVGHDLLAADQPARRRPPRPRGAAGCRQRTAHRRCRARAVRLPARADPGRRAAAAAARRAPPAARSDRERLARNPEVSNSASRAAEWAAHVLPPATVPRRSPATAACGPAVGRRHAYGAAWRQYSRVIDLLDRSPTRSTPDPRTVLVEAAEAARWSGELAEAVDPRRAGAPGAAPTTDEQAAIAERIGRYLVEAGRLDDAEAAFARAEELAADVDDAALAARVAVSSARLLMQTGRYRQAIPQARPRLELAAAADVPGRAGPRAHRARDEPGPARRARRRRAQARSRRPRAGPRARRPRRPAPSRQQPVLRAADRRAHARGVRRVGAPGSR